MGVSPSELILLYNYHINQHSVRTHNLPLIHCHHSDKLAFHPVQKRKKEKGGNCSPPKPSSITRRFRTAVSLSRPDRHTLHAPVGTHLNSATSLCPFWPPCGTCAAEISMAERTFRSTVAQLVKTPSRWTSPLRPRQEPLPPPLSPTRLNLFGARRWVLLPR